MKYILIFLIAASAMYAQDVKQGTLIVHITKIDTTIDGQIVAKLHRGLETWLKDAEVINEVKALPDNDTVVVKFEDIIFSKYYAVQVFHDEDLDGEIDFSFFPPGPEEGVGISNNNLSMGPPRFKDARFEFSVDKQVIENSMNY